MTRRILCGFVAVLALVIVGVVVPLGWIVSAQHTRDYRSNALVTAQSLGAIAEEKLGDHEKGSTLDEMLAEAQDHTDNVAVLTPGGALVGTIGRTLPASWLEAAHNGTLSGRSDGQILVSAPIGDDDEQPVGIIVIARSAVPMDRWIMMLWSMLIFAAIVVLAIGALVGWSLARWITRPLTGLAAAARELGSGRLAVRADGETGPKQVQQVAVAFNDMADKVVALLEAQRGMTADVSHQLRTPLAALRLRMELLFDDTEETERGQLQAMLAEIGRLSRLVDGLLAVARAEAVISVPVPTDVAAVSAARIAAWLPVAAERGVTLEIDAGVAIAATTEGHLEQILDNLIANALDAVPPNGSVRLKVTSSSEQAVLRIVDSGPGMTADQRDHAFGRFVTDRRDRGGTGLGLAIVGRLVATDRGEARLEETPGGGLTVEIRLPLVPQRRRREESTIQRWAEPIADAL
jgi:signal transduction histidine kinase